MSEIRRGGGGGGGEVERDRVVRRGVEAVVICANRYFFLIDSTLNKPLPTVIDRLQCDSLEGKDTHKKRRHQGRRWYQPQEGRLDALGPSRLRQRERCREGDWRYCFGYLCAVWILYWSLRGGCRMANFLIGRRLPPRVSRRLLRLKFLWLSGEFDILSL